MPACFCFSDISRFGKHLATMQAIHSLASLMLTLPIGSLHATRRIANRSLRSIYHFLLTMFNSQPSGINPSKKEKRVFQWYSSFCKGSVKLTADALALVKY